MEEKNLDLPSERQKYTVREQAHEEANKLFYDVFKHLTTLSTGSILILASLLETLFSNPQWKILIVVALLSFIVSIVSAVRMMFFQASAMMNLKAEITLAEHVSFIVTVSSFLLGIISFVAFAIKNFYG